MNEQEQMARDLFNEINRDFKSSNRTRRTELPDFATLKGYFNECKIEFTIGWYDNFVVTFRPKTIGVKYHKSDKKEDKSISISKSYPLEQPNLLDTILDLYKPKL